MPARNEERDIAACVETLRCQDIDSEYEIIVVDNGSTDETADRARRAGAIVVNEPRPGLARARLAGLLAARGDLLIYVDADSRLPCGWAREVVRQFETDGRLVGLSTGFRFHDGRIIDRLGSRLFSGALGPAANFALARCGRPGVLVGSAMAVRTHALRQAGGVAQAFQFYGEDTMLACRLHKQGAVRFVREPLYSTSARRYQHVGLLSVIYRYFTLFVMIHMGKYRTASLMARRFQESDRRDYAESLIKLASTDEHLDWAARQSGADERSREPAFGAES